ncbi:MAG: glycosyltransferase WbuB, partial [Pseudomonadota bacterium]
MTDAAPRRVLIIVENLPVPFDRRVWAEATTLAEAGYVVSVISPKL